MNTKTSTAWLATLAAGLLLSAPAATMAQEALFARQAPGGAYDLFAVDEATLDVTVAQSGVDFLPVRLAGYALRDRLRTDLPRLVDAEGPAPHVRLPSQGSVYLLRKEATTAGPATRLVLNRAGGGLVGLAHVLDTPTGPGLQDWLTVSPDGTKALLATTLAAGGDVLLVDLTQQSPVTNLTAQLPPLAVEAESLRVGGQRAWFVADGTVYRVRLTAGQMPLTETVDLGLDPGEKVLPELLLSHDGRFLSAVGENAQGQRHIYVAYPFGTGRRVTQTAGDYDPPSLQSPIGPLLALSPDGGRIAYRQRITDSRELFVRRVGSSGTPDQITRDAQFTDTIDNVGILGFVDNDLLVFAAGEGTAAGPNAFIDGADIYMVPTTLVGSEPVNISQTSGFATVPFNDYGTMQVVGAALDPTGTQMLLDIDPEFGPDHALYAVSLTGQPGVTELLPSLQSAPILAPAGEATLVVSRPPLPSPVRQQVHLLSRPQAGGLGTFTLLAQSDDASVTFAHFNESRAGDKAAFVVSGGPGNELPGLVDVGGQGLTPVWNQLMSVTPNMAFTPGGRLALGVGTPGGPSLFIGFAGPGDAVVYPIEPGNGFPLDN